MTAVLIAFVVLAAAGLAVVGRLIWLAAHTPAPRLPEEDFLLGGQWGDALAHEAARGLHDLEEWLRDRKETR